MNLRPTLFTLLALSTLPVLFADQADALMVGTSPDSPAARVDPNTADSPWAGVGSLSVGAGTYTATLISPNHVLTAAHVVAGVAPGAITFNLNFGGDLTQRIGAAQIFIYPGYSGFNSPNLNDDLAIIRLAQPAPTGAPIYRLQRGALPPGTTLTFVGYGASGRGNDTAGATVPPSPTVKRTGQNHADRFALDNEGSGKANIYSFDFDGPTAASNLMGNLTLGNNFETMVAGGDSGSPAFVRGNDGDWQLAGVNAFTFDVRTNLDQARSTFGTGGGGMLVSAYTGWIDGVVTTPKQALAPASYALLLGSLGLVGFVVRRRTKN